MTIAEVKRPLNLSGIGDRNIPETTPCCASESRYTFAIWIALIGIFFPAMLISLGGINATLGRFVVIVFLVPVFGILFGGHRNRLASDLFAIAAAIWILAASALNDAFRPYVGAEALEFLGAYMVGRVFVFGPSNFRTFIRALKPISAVVIALALLDVLVGRYVTLDTFAVPNAAAQRYGLVRASSVFEGAEHYGTFCVATAAIFLYSERGLNRALYVGLCIFGCALSLSSGPLFGLVTVMVVFCYDCILKRYSFRWKALVTVVVGFLMAIFLFSEQPIPWMLMHFTLDPQTGFFRLATWSYAIPLIEQSPWVGHGVVRFGGEGDQLIFLSSVDCVWLLEALRYGLPGLILLLMVMFSPLLSGPSTGGESNEQTGLTVAIVATVLIGLTVHFWDATWLYLNLCVGIRAAFAEYRLREMWQPGWATRSYAVQVGHDDVLTGASRFTGRWALALKFGPAARVPSRGAPANRSGTYLTSSPVNKGLGD